MSEDFTGQARKMYFQTDLGSKQKQDQHEVAIANLQAEITALKDRVKTLEDA